MNKNPDIWGKAVIKETEKGKAQIKQTEKKGTQKAETMQGAEEKVQKTPTKHNKAKTS